MATSYSAWSDTWRPSGSSVDKKYRARLDTSVGSDATRYWVTATVYVNINSSVEAYYKGRVAGTSQTTYTSGNVTTSFGGSTTVYAISTTYYWARKTSAYTVYVSGYAWSDKKSWDGYWMGTSQSFTVPALPSYTISYNKNGGNSGTVPSQTKYYNTAMNVTTSQYRWVNEDDEDEWAFKGWNTRSDGSGTSYASGAPYPASSNASATLYAQWTALYPPTCDYSELVDKHSEDYDGYKKNFSELAVQIDADSIDIHTGRDLSSVTLSLGDGVSPPTTLTKAQLESADYEITIVPRASGENIGVTLDVEDTAGATTTYLLGEIEVTDPTWTYTPTFDSTIVKFPDLNASAVTDIIVMAEQYDQSTNTGTGTFDVIPNTYMAIDNGDDTWSLPIVLGELYVSDVLSTTPDANIKVQYHHTDTEEKESMEAFYNTTRNANFSTGISNTMFISGCESANYSSRVWWSQINNPLYFPDLNYVEVGSNDTSVMGLCKVGDYLGVVKQSKTTDTAIFLIYPTSFEDDTTYAVKQLSSGVGAYGKYTFNVLGDETLFLSPNGVMAIVPSEDNDHKVQNRSYFVDGKLLKEPKIKDAYSFVFEGKYYLAVNDHCYVLDGNQRNSWGNDKTNLVYECYYLEGVPANCFVKYNDTLYFSNDYGLCRFKDKEDATAYRDAYDIIDEPVKARWSTIVDDDGALNYYKTMQKKGNVISILPNLPIRYKPVVVTEEEFNAGKTNFFFFSEETGGYVRCTEDSVYDENVQYYVKTSSTKVYVRKDMNEPVEIQRQFGESTEIPSELFVNKKFKKYKRLQFIVENNEAEPFGVDSIIKQYTIGNYAKR